ncbi:MAG: inorganic phosphate transporter [Planctomycetes bacterium]|nr:inorganic phosphate transporter [Planctomycetota bacterium]
MDPIVLVVLVVIAALVFDFTNGWNDSANAIATVVSTRVLRPMTAVLWGAALNFVGALVSTKVAKTIGAGVVDLPPDLKSELVVLGAMIAAAAWVAWCTRLGLPISASHALIGGLTGAAVGLYGFAVLKWDGVTKILVALFLSPCLGFVVAFILLAGLYSGAVGFRIGRVRAITAAVGGGALVLGGGALLILFSSGALAWEEALAWGQKWSHSAIVWLVIPVSVIAFAAMFFLKGLSVTQSRRLYGPLQLCSSSFMAFEHGKNDAQKVMGVIALALFAGGLLKDENGAVIADIDKIDVPLWVMLACGAAIALGTAVGGWKVIRTLGTKLAHITPADGFVAETTAGLVLEGAAELGVPVSTTHTITGAILGVGAAKQVSAVRWGLGAKIIYAWIFTLPVCFVLGAVFSVIAQRLGPIVLVTLAVLVTVVVLGKGRIQKHRAGLLEASKG